jgi:hypothetical protein
VVGLLLKALLSRITHTFVNGKLVYNAFKVKNIRAGKDCCLIVKYRDEKILFLLVLLLSFASCKEDLVAKPDQLIAKDQMIDIMYDLAVLEGIKYQNPSSLDSNQINSATYIYKKV